MTLVRIKDLEVTIGSKIILEDINLEIEEGSVTTFVGPSGSGKTTLLRTINLLQEQSKGSIEIDGILAEAGKISKATVHDIRKHSTMVFQHFNLFKNLTVRDNVAIPLILTGQANRKEANERAEEVLEKLGLIQLADQYPVTLSGGQQQRVSIARAIASKPKIVLFDEPTSALDPELVESVLQTIETLARENISMVLVTHEMEFARRLSDQVFFLENGKILAKGSAKEILSKEGYNTRIRNFVSSLSNKSDNESLASSSL